MVSLNTLEIVLLIFTVLMVGIGKGGVPGSGMIAIPIVALIFGGKPSTGIILPVLIFADIVAVVYYRQHLNKKHLLRLLPWAVVGVFIALIIGDIINDKQFLFVIAVTIISGLLLVIAKDLHIITFDFGKNMALAIVLGLAGGFASMIGNAAGPIMTLYLLTMGFKKNEFIGTRAWFFFIINIIKLPLHIFVWETITITTFSYALWMLPILFFGVFLGIKLMKIVPEKIFKIIVYTTTIISSILLLV